MTAAHPWALLLLGIIPLVVVLRRRGWGHPPTLDYPDTRGLQAVFRGGRRPGGGPREWLRLAAIGLLVAAAAAPEWMQAATLRSGRGVDLVVVLDISGSMSARDFDPLTRLQAAKSVMREFLSAQQGNRIGLVAFAARAYVVCPLTYDLTTLQTLLDHLAIGMTTDGSAIGLAVAAALNRFRESKAPSRAILLLTDGRNNAGSLEPKTAAELAAALGVRIYTIGMGEPGGGPILVKKPAEGESVLLNADGSVHLEGMDEETLETIAKTTGGRYFRATDRTKLETILNEIGELEQRRLTAPQFRRRIALGPWFLLAALLVLVVETVIVRRLDARIP